MPRFVEVHHHEWIEAPVAVVKAQFVDLDHHISKDVHPDFQFTVLEQRPSTARFVQDVRFFGIRQRDTFERRIETDGSFVDTSVKGFNKGGTVAFRFASEAMGAKTGTRVDVAVRIPLPPIVGPLLRPVFAAQIRKQTKTATEQDRVDLEQQRFPW
jgi:hypothetical protein